MLGWGHSGFSVEAGTRVYDDAARQSLSQYIVRAHVGLEKLTWDPDDDTLSWKAPDSARRAVHGFFEIRVRDSERKESRSVNRALEGRGPAL
jgi:hypothetical protein